MGQRQPANAKHSQEFRDMQRATETLSENLHQCSVQGGKETLTPSKLQDLATHPVPSVYLLRQNCQPGQLDRL